MNIDQVKKTLRFVHNNPHSDFYRRRFESAGFDPERDFNGPEDISKIPLLDRSELMQAGDSKLLFVPEDQVEIVAATSGTSSNNPLLACHVPDPENPGVYHMNTTRRMLVLMHPTRAGHILQRLNHVKVRGLIGDTHNVPMTLTLASRVGIEEIYTTPTLAIMSRKFFDKQPEFLSRLKCIRLIGEPYTPRKKKMLHDLYPGIEINGRYGSAEADRIAQQCEHQGKPSENNEVLYHLIPESFHYEIIDPDTGVVLGNNVQGELVITTLSNLGTPLIRYRTGDLATLKETSCACGQSGPLLEIHGRTASDSVRAGGFDLKAEMVEEPMLRLRHVIKSDFEIHLYEEYQGAKPSVRAEIHVSLLPGVSDNGYVRQEILREFEEYWRISPSMSLKAAIANDLFLPLEIKFVDFPYHAKTITKMIAH